MADIDVAPGGSIACSYYDQRNTTKPVTEYWLSSSTNGGNTWVDVPVSDHTFTPAPIQGLVYGYQGDYTGITTAAGKVWPFWCDNSSGIYQVWTAGISIIGIKPIGNDIPEKFLLEQNFPNPFNPVTKIRFSIPNQTEGAAQNVNLVIFDLLGREAAKPVNEELNAGKYEVDFDGSMLTSGVYFYRLTSTGHSNRIIYTETRKMLLVK